MRYSAGIKLKTEFITSVKMSSIVFLMRGLNVSDNAFQCSFRNAFVLSSEERKRIPMLDYRNEEQRLTQKLYSIKNII